MCHEYADLRYLKREAEERMKRPSARRPLRQLRRRSPPAGWLRSCAGWSRRSGRRRRRSPPSKAPLRSPPAPPHGVELGPRSTPR